jgi:very-short-patch-repair endonuclease
MKNKESEIKSKEKNLQPRKRLTTAEKIIKAISTHGDRYDYSKLPEKFYVMDKVPIVCNEHGVFYQTWDNHTNKKQNCPKCGGYGFSLKENIDRVNKIHNNKYDYSLIKTNPSKNDKIKIICPEHGIIEKRWEDHLSNKTGCKKCAGFDLSLSEKIDIANKTHDNKYDYSLLPNEFKTMSKVNIICPEHGEFKQCWSNHIHGKDGCPSCKSSKGENSIRIFLNEHKIYFIHQKSFDNCRNDRTGRMLVFDFYIPSYNLCIEYDGAQHTKPVEFFGGIKEYNDIKYKDEIKNKYCKDNNINLLRISYKNRKNIENILKINLDIQKTLHILDPI